MNTNKVEKSFYYLQDTIITQIIQYKNYNLIMIRTYNRIASLKNYLQLTNAYFSNENPQNKKKQKRMSEYEKKLKMNLFKSQNLTLFDKIRNAYQINKEYISDLQNNLEQVKQIENKKVFLSQYFFKEQNKKYDNKSDKNNKDNNNKDNNNKDNSKQGNNKQSNNNKDKNKQEMSQQDRKRLSKPLKMLLYFGLFLYFFSPQKKPTTELYSQNFRKSTLGTLLDQIKNGNSKQMKITISKQSHKSLFLLTNEIGNYKKNRYSITITETELTNFLNELQKMPQKKIPITFNYQSVTQNLTSWRIQNIMKYILFGVVAFIAYKIFKKYKQIRPQLNLNNILGMKKYQPIHSQNIQILFKDVAGMHEAKSQITQFVDFLKKPQKYINMGAKVPKGALLTGPPGTGKTLLAKACAGESGVPFFSVSGSEFIQKYSGLGAARVRNLFDAAQKNAPSIIFIDEIDAIGKTRSSGPFANEQRDNTLNQLLVKMDGFDTKNKVIVMAATNRKDMLDSALLRPGRFDRSVQIGLPSYEERIEIFKIHLSKVKYDPKLTPDELAKKISRLTPGFSGADLANTCNEAAILAARDKLDMIPLEKFQKATERVMAGLEKRNVFSDEEKQMLAFYQAGKVVVNWFTEGADPVIKVSILPFSKSKAGYSHSLKDETALHTKDQLFAKICCYLAGRCCQQHFKKYVSTNGQQDLQRAKKIIQLVVTKFGMSQPLKMIAFPDYDFIRKPYSQKTQTIIDEEMSKITLQCERKVQQLIKQKQQKIIKIKQKLLQKQTLNHNDIKQILGERPFAAHENYNQYLKDLEENQSQRLPDDGPSAGVATG